MMKIAITGGIGSGKSFVCNILERRGLSIYNCDNEAKRIITSSERIQSGLRSVVGDNVFLGKKLNKAVLTQFLLKNEENAKKINNIVHPVVAEDFIRSGLKFMECAILFSSGFNHLVDKIICVTAPIEIRIKRIMERDNISYQRACEWIDNQMSQEEIVALSDYEIINDGRADLIHQIDLIFKSLDL